MFVKAFALVTAATAASLIAPLPHAFSNFQERHAGGAASARKGDRLPVPVTSHRTIVVEQRADETTSLLFRIPASEVAVR